MLSSPSVSVRYFRVICKVTIMAPQGCCMLGRGVCHYGSQCAGDGPGQCIMVEGNPVTKRRLEDADCNVLTYRGNEISLKAEGGATCLTRSILRDNE